MIELFAIVILVIGFMGMSVIIIRKIPVLAELPLQEIETSPFLKNIGNKIGDIGIFRSFSKGILLQKIVSKIRILTLKTDNKTSNWLIKLRQKSAKKRNNFSDDYWKKLKKGE